MRASTCNLHWTAVAWAGGHTEPEEGSTGLGEVDTGLGEVDTGLDLGSTGLEGAGVGLGAGMEEAVHLDLL